MSSVFGLVMRDGVSVSAAALRAMQQAITTPYHEDRTTLVEAQAGFGQLTLPETAEDDPAQSLRYDAARQLLFVGEGRLDNRDDLLAVLVRNERNAAVSDVELVRRAYLRWSTTAPTRLYGDWSFAAYDLRARKLVLARDHFGETALYYYVNEHLVAFSSDIRALLVLGLPGLRINEIYLAHGLTPWRFASGEDTIVDPIRRLAPGHTLEITPREVRLQQYWSFEDVPEVRFPRRTDYVEAMTSLFDDAVRARLRLPHRVGASNAGIAVSMSGGLDSTSVAASAARQVASSAPVVALTSVPQFDPSPAITNGDESGNATETARLVGLDHHLIRSDELSPVAAIRHTVSLLPEPLLMGGNLHWVLSIWATTQRLGCPVLLTGSAGNATASWEGNVASQPLHVQVRLRGVSWTVKNLLMTTATQHLGSPAARLVHQRLISQHERFLRTCPTAILPEFAERISLYSRWASQDVEARRSRSQLSRLRHMLVSRGAFTPIDAAHGVVVRDPTADLRLLSFTVGIPDRLFVDPETGAGRWLIRSAMRSRLPSQVLDETRTFRQSSDLTLRLRSVAVEVEELLEELVEVAGEVIDVEKLRSAWETVGREHSLVSLQLVWGTLMRAAVSGLAVAHLRRTLP